ncbi:MAG: pantoate--beta-alanine ligase [Arenicella sp.]
MNIIKRISQLRAAVKGAKQANKRVAFVPTMGNLHQGHLDLVKRAKLDGDFVIVSIYVNPLQFGDNEDLSSYPRTEQEDAMLLADLEVDLLFLPDTNAMYPGDIAEQTLVDIPTISGLYCGEQRPIHFRGVTTVVARLFNIVQPDVAVFGKKDYQQLFLIKKMVEDLAFPIEILGVETTREESGLAMSSRNGYLKKTQLKKAVALRKELLSLSELVTSEKANLRKLTKAAMKNLEKAGFEPHYVHILNRITLLEAHKDDKELVIIAAGQMGKARLIDNIEVDI